MSPTRSCNRSPWSRVVSCASFLGVAAAQAAEVGLPTGASSLSALSAAEPTASAPVDRFSPVSWQRGDWRGFLTFTGQLRYDDNILLTDRHVLADFIGAAIPSANVDYAPAGQDSAFLAHLDYTPQFVGYLRNPGFDTIDHNAGVDLEETLGHSQFKAAHRFTLSTAPALEQTSRAQVETQATELYSGYDLTAKTTLSLAPRQEWSSVDNGVTLWEYGATAELTHHQTEKLDWKLSYYAGEATATPGVSALMQVAFGGVSWEVSGRSRVDLHAGLDSVSYAGSSAQVSPDVLLDWFWQLTGKTTARLNVAYQSDVSEYVAYQMNRTFLAQVALSHTLTEKIALELRSRGGLLEQTAMLNGTGSGGELPFWGIGCGAAYHFNRHMDLRVDFDHEERGGNVFYDPYHRNVVQLSLQYRF